MPIEEEPKVDVIDLIIDERIVAMVDGLRYKFGFSYQQCFDHINRVLEKAGRDRLRLPEFETIMYEARD